MDEHITLNDTVALMRDLRKRCEWDAAQTHESLRPYLIEESQELDDALRERNPALMREELGDLLLQVLFHSVIAEERGEFDVHDVARGLIAKMKARHPHLYGDGVKEPWEKMKSKKRESIGDGLPAGLPPLHRAHRLQDRAAGVGFDWPDTAGPALKIEEELSEVRHHLDARSLAVPGAPPVQRGMLSTGQWIELHGPVVRIGTINPADVQPAMDALRAAGLIIRQIGRAHV